MGEESVLGGGEGRCGVSVLGEGGEGDVREGWEGGWGGGGEIGKWWVGRSVRRECERRVGSECVRRGWRVSV